MAPLSLQPVSPEVVNAAGSSLIKDTALGAITIICLALTVWAIRELKKVQDQRVRDMENSAKRYEEANEKDRAAQAALTQAVNALASAHAETNRATERNTHAIQEHTRALEGVIRDAIRRAGTSGGYPATPRSRDPREEPK